MVIINGIYFPENSKAIVLEPRECHDAAIIDYDTRRDIAIYSERLFLMSLMMCQGYSYMQAIEWYTYNTLCTSVENYPIFITEDGDEAL